jgi:hypothetical protein
MADETNVTEVVENENLNYIETIKQLKQTTVPKTELEKLQAENKKLLSTLLEGGELEAAATTPQKRTSDEIRKELFSDDAQFTNLAFAQKAIELREAILDEGGIDPFVPQGNNIVAEDSDFAAAEKVAEALKSCIEYANGDSEVFTNELMRLTVDTSPVSTRARGNRR